MQQQNYTTIDEYLAQFDGEYREKLEMTRCVIKEAAPDAVEKISYRMPCYWLNGPVVYFAHMKNHLGFYPTNEGIESFIDVLSKYSVSKGAVRFPWKDTIPYELIKQITEHRISIMRDL